MTVTKVRFNTPVRTAKRYFLAYGAAHVRNIIVVNEFPKSGGTWISNLISTALELPFYDNLTPPTRPQILKGHFYNPWTMNRGVLVWRDGRDVMVSWYHHCFHKFKDVPINHRTVDHMRAKYNFADYDDIRANLPAFLEREMKTPFYPSFTWPQFVERWHDNRRMVHVRYEDMRSNPNAELAKTIRRLGHDSSESALQAAIDKFDIKKVLVEREKSGDMSRNFVRAGNVGEWRDIYTDEALQIFEHYGGQALKALGYG
ncbi:sulfotransferase domain-containing protein [Mesorhizobium sp. J18]|uniref:sulfotransferase domain-containing protein n=1 Tax=Mesorhizobium sp. J18 TaxID=935263 RepID=UPI0011996A41|nr:sulfotransferase domain-containing protein [Mesorhizobium sp. J18]TWG95398.1 sulfotransferase domain-containing protein [Mesorhizobium sp. J18]